MRRMIVVLGALLLVALGAGVAYASIPGGDGVIHACYKTSNPAQGALMVIDSAATCPNGFTALIGTKLALPVRKGRREQLGQYL